tara:strand:- start:4072 stop:5313 length:1242 start_codon:yes stop_codon:yes gene_type:complete
LIKWSNRKLGEEIFSGNVYILIPAYIKNNVSFKASPQCEPSHQAFIDDISFRFNDEVSSLVHKSFSRSYLGTFSLACFDELECEADQQNYQDAELFLSLDSKTGLAVLTIRLFEKQLPVSQLLDRLSKGDILFNADIGNGIQLEELLSPWGISVLTTSAKACLSTRQEIPKDILPYYIANETYASKNMSAQITSKEFKHQMSTNIAQYDSSDIFVGKHSVIRIDRRESQHHYPKLESDGTFLFVLEALLYKEAAVLRTNKKVLTSIERNELLALDVLNELTAEFSSTIPFWDIKIFNYLTAQQLANNLDDRFGINQHFELYEKNQQLLQYRINLKEGIEQEKKNNILYIIAVILFIFEIAPHCYALFTRIISGKGFSLVESLSLLSAGLFTALLATILVLVISNKKKKHNASL